MVAFIFGAGGHARVIASLIDGPVTLVDREMAETFLAGGELARSKVYLGIGDDVVRRRLFERLRDLGITPASCIASTAFVARDAQIGPGSVICPGAVVMAGARVGANVIVNTLASVDHDGAVGDHSQICPGATLAGNVTLGEQVFLGMRSAVLPGVTIGEGSKLRAGSVVWHDIPPRVLAGGNPAKVIRQI